MVDSAAPKCRDNVDLPSDRRIGLQEVCRHYPDIYIGAVTEIYQCSLAYMYYRSAVLPR